MSKNFEQYAKELIAKPILEDAWHRDSVAWHIKHYDSQARRLTRRSGALWLGGALAVAMYLFSPHEMTQQLQFLVAAAALGIFLAMATKTREWYLCSKGYRKAMGDLDTATKTYWEKNTELHSDAIKGDDQKKKELQLAFDALCRSTSEAFRSADRLAWGSGTQRQKRRDAFVEKIGSRLEERRELLSGALKVEEKILEPGAAAVLQSRVTDDAKIETSQPTAQESKTTTNQATGKPESGGQTADEDHERDQAIKVTPAGDKSLHPDRPTLKDIQGAVDYRLAIADLFVEKAQFHLEARADRYEWLGYALYAAAVLLFIAGTSIAIWRMLSFNESWPPNADQSPNGSVVERLSPSRQSDSQYPIAWILSKRAGSEAYPEHGDSTDKWIHLLRGFIRSFTAYGLVVLTAVVFTRGAKACLDQRERLLAKRHSLRQGRLYLHLTGGRVTVEDLAQAFNWNHDQRNAFTSMQTEAKAPFGAAIEEIVKMVPELVKSSMSASRELAARK